MSGYKVNMVGQRDGSPSDDDLLGWQQFTRQRVASTNACSYLTTTGNVSGRLRFRLRRLKEVAWFLEGR